MAEMDTGYVASSETGQESQARARERISEKRDRVSQYGGMARKKVVELADSRKSTVVASLDRLAQGLEDAGTGDGGGPERQFMQKAAGYIRQASDTLERRSSDELLNMAFTEIRDRPAAIIAGMFVVGFFGARLLRT